jgi:hypothetical protein
MQGEYISLLLGLDQNASAARKLQSDAGANNTTFEEYDSLVIENVTVIHVTE